MRAGLCLMMGCAAGCAAAESGIASGEAASTRKARDREAIEGALASAAPSCREVALPWGAGPGEVGLQPAVPERPARGPQAVAVAADGAVLVLDAVNGRVVRVDASGAAGVAIAAVPRDAEDLAAGADGALAVYSPLQARAWVFVPDGAPAGELALDRAIRHVTGIALGASRRLVLRTAYQETLVAGSPAAAAALATVLHGKREGAALLADGRGVAVRAAGGAAALFVVDSPAGRRATTVASHDLPGRVDAAQVFGLAAGSSVACLRAEQVDQDVALRVTRRAVCVDALTGRVALDVPLRPPGLYQPAQELAVGGAPGQPIVAALHAAPAGLTITTCEVAR